MVIGQARNVLLAAGRRDWLNSPSTKDALMIGYLDCPSGISGDMFLSCLVDAGWSLDELKRTLKGLAVPGEEYELGSKSVMKGPLRATQVTVSIVATKQHRHLPDIRQIVNGSDLSQRVKDRAIA